MSKAVVFFADGTEECEALLVIDLLRRAKVEVTVASAMGRKELVSSHKIHLTADALAEDVDYSDVDLVVLPGGIPGTPNLAANKTVTETCKAFAAAGKKVAAICAAPSVLAALGLLRMTEKSRMGADAAIAVVSASSLAAGVVVTSLTTGLTTDVDSFMFGSILALDRADVALSVGVCAAVLVLYVLFYHRLFAITFDESFSRATGVKVELYNTVLSVLTALTIVLGMRLMGAMLISSLVIFPALTAMRLLRSFRGVVLCAAAVSVLGFCAGLTGSYLLSTPVGATVVLVDLAVFLLACLLGRLKKHA